VPRNVAAEREALEGLVRSDGWKLFCAHIEMEWSGLGYFARMGTALASADTVNPKAVHQAALEIRRTLEWPAYQIRELKGDPGDE
jgi:hypothetical protein